MVEPSPRSMNRGSPPTERKARTGLLTPPGNRLTARSMSRADRSIVSKVLASRLSPLPCKTRKPPCKRLTEVYYLRPVPAVTELTPTRRSYRLTGRSRGSSSADPLREPGAPLVHAAAHVRGVGGLQIRPLNHPTRCLGEPAGD